MCKREKETNTEAYRNGQTERERTRTTQSNSLELDSSMGVVHCTETHTQTDRQTERYTVQLT